MRYPSPRAVAGLSLVVALLGVLTLGPRLARGQLKAVPVPAAPPAAVPPGKDKGQAINVMTFPSDRDAKQMIEAVQQYLKEFEAKPDKAPWDKICFAAQQVLDAKSDSFFELAKKGDDSGKYHGVSAKAEANRLIGQFPSEGRQFYQFTYGPEAQKLLTQSVDAGYDRGVLADVSLRYFHTKAGAQATLLLAGFHLERGNFSEAAYSFERLLARPDADDLLTPRTLFKVIVALKRGGSVQSEAIDKLWARLEKKFPRDGLLIGRKSYSLDDLRQEASRPFETLFGRVGETYAATRYGNASHTAVADGGAPFLDPAFAVSMTYRTEEAYLEGATWINQNLADVLKNIKPEKGETAIPGFFPVTTPNLILYRTYDGVYATVTKDGFLNNGKPARTGELYWISATDGSLNQLMGGEDKAPQKWWDTYRQPQYASILFDNPLVGSLSHDGQNVYFIDDLALPPPPQQTPEGFGMPVPPQATMAGSGNGLTDGSRLKAVNIETGKIDWVLGAPVVGAPALTDEEEDKATNPLLLMQSSFFLGPPLPLNGKLYVLFERSGKIRLACLDPGKVSLYVPPVKNEADKRTYRVPELLWTQRLGEPNTRLPLDTFRRFQCSYLAYADGVMICPTNAGALVAVDIMSRSLLWAQSYRFIKQPQVPDHRMGRFPGGGVMPVGAGGGQSQLSQDRWRAAAPIISKGRVVFAAFDSDAVNCLDLRTGALIWSEPRRPGDLYVGGLVGDKVLVVGKESVRAIDLAGDPVANPTPAGPKETVKYAWKDVRIGTPAGHGTASKGGVYYIPLAATPDAARPEVWAIDVERGKVTDKIAYRKKENGGDGKPLLGNLVFHEGQLYSQSPTELVAFPLRDQKKGEMTRLLKANPHDPVGLVARGELSLESGQWKEAVADFQEARKNHPPPSVRDRLRDKLYQAYTELLREDFNAGEQYLPEYERLCDVPLDTDDPNLRQKLADEQFKRKALYLRLLARGRENQGKLVEAFDRYREFAALGAGKQLVAIDDQPNGLTRPDVWARGRIQAMIRGAKDPAARKPLEDRVAREWEAVRAANDLPRLREFVTVFGPYFAAGRDGELLLARRLLETNNDDDLREAQAILLQLWATADDRTVQARAVEALARVMTKAGLLEDAVGLYTRLGTEYPTVTVRDGKTGADFLNDLLTDKRLLPYLEPTRVPTPARIKVEQHSGAGGAVHPSGFTFEPEGDLLPFFRRYRLSLSNNESNNGTWVLRVSDRNTGQERHRFPGLRVLSPNGIPPRVGCVSGHLLLLQLGHIAYCFDLAENKELWQYNLLGESARIDTNNVQYDTGADGETTVSYMADGFKIRLGRSAVLEANYACLVTRDGLVAVDPASGAKLWTRAVLPTAQVFGDARHVFVVESEPNGRARSRVLRAVDGVAADGVPDFGELFTGGGRVRVMGRLLLLTAGGTGGKPRVVRLYDPLTGKDVWSKSFSPEGKFIHTLTADYVGVLEPTGTFTVLEANTGKPVFTGRVDAKNVDAHVKPATKPVLLHDAERFYLVLNADRPARSPTYYYAYMPLRATQVSGPVYAFDRASGRRLWYTDKLFEHQALITERFADTPALIAATQTVEEGTNLGVYRVIVVDKQNGKIRYLKGLPQAGVFYAMTSDPVDRSTRLVRGDLSVRITPDEPEKTAARK